MVSNGRARIAQPTRGGKTYGGQYGTITQANLDKLLTEGATRWQKNGNDRLYFNAAGDKIIGLEYETYKTGNVSYAELDGEKIANSRVARVMETYKRAYMDLTTGAIRGLVETPYYDRFLEGMKKYRKKKG